VLGRLWHTDFAICSDSLQVVLQVKVFIILIHFKVRINYIIQHTSIIKLCYHPNEPFLIPLAICTWIWHINLKAYKRCGLIQGFLTGVHLPIWRGAFKVSNRREIVCLHNNILFISIYTYSSEDYFKNHYMLIGKYIFVIFLTLFVWRNFRGTCLSVKMLKGYMARESSGTPALINQNQKLSVQRSIKIKI